MQEFSSSFPHNGHLNLIYNISLRLTLYISPFSLVQLTDLTVTVLKKCNSCSSATFICIRFSLHSPSAAAFLLLYVIWSALGVEINPCSHGMLDTSEISTIYGNNDHRRPDNLVTTCNCINKGTNGSY